MTVSPPADPPDVEAILQFRLFVAGDSPRSIRAIENLRKLGEGTLEGHYEVEVVDVLEHPERAEEDRILATPTLVKHSPPPDRRVMGDLSDLETVLRVLVPRSSSGDRYGAVAGPGTGPSDPGTGGPE